MPSIDSMVTSKSSFLRKEDVGETGVNLAIKAFKQEQVGQGEESELKFVIQWTNPQFKPMVLNKENASRLKMVFKTDDTDQMIGKVVNVYSDPFVAFGGKTVGGLRIRSAQAQQGNAPRQQADMGPETPPLDAYSEKEFNDQIPF